MLKNDGTGRLITYTFLTGGDLANFFGGRSVQLWGRLILKLQVFGLLMLEIYINLSETFIDFCCRAAS